MILECFKIETLDNKIIKEKIVVEKLNVLFTEWLKCKSKWQQYCEFFGHSKERVDFFESAAKGIAGNMQRIFYDDVILSVCRLVDNNKKTLSIKDLSDCIADSELKREVEDLVNVAKEKSIPMIKYRHHVVAHLNEGVALKEPKTISSLESDLLNRKKITEAIEAIFAPFSLIHVETSGRDLDNEIIEPSYELNFLQLLYLGQEEHKRREQQRKRADYPEYIT